VIPGAADEASCGVLHVLTGARSRRRIERRVGGNHHLVYRGGVSGNLFVVPGSWARRP